MILWVSNITNLLSGQFSTTCETENPEAILLVWECGLSIWDAYILWLLSYGKEKEGDDGRNNLVLGTRPPAARIIESCLNILLSLGQSCKWLCIQIQTVGATCLWVCAATVRRVLPERKFTITLATIFLALLAMCAVWPLWLLLQRPTTSNFLSPLRLVQEKNQGGKKI